MVELSSSTDPFQHGFPNIVFILPAIVVVGLAVFFGYKLYLSLTEKERKREEKLKAKQVKKKKWDVFQRGGAVTGGRSARHLQHKNIPQKWKTKIAAAMLVPMFYMFYANPPPSTKRNQVRLYRNTFNW